MVVCRTVPKPILRVIYYLLTAKSMGNAINKSFIAVSSTFHPISQYLNQTIIFGS